jgi:hypothetical protein
VSKIPAKNKSETILANKKTLEVVMGIAEGIDLQLEYMMMNVLGEFTNKLHDSVSGLNHQLKQFTY